MPERLKTRNEYNRTYAGEKPVRIEYRPDARKRGYTWEWQKARKRFLAENPLCAECARLGTARRATDVDHIVPHRGDKALFWDRANWQGLCREHHSAKTARGE